MKVSLLRGLKSVLSVNPHLLAFCRTVKFRVNYPISRLILKNQIIKSRRKERIHKICPVCNNDTCVEFEFIFEGEKIKKYMCIQCGHLFSVWLQTDLNKAQGLFDYNQGNPWKSGQKYLLVETVRYSNRTGRYLDFGVGGNISASQELNNELEDTFFYACDINKRNEENYFITYEDDSMLGTFNGIASSEVIEHLDNTVEAWQYFNRLLKPIRDSEGVVMVHSFPSQLHCDLSHWGIQIKSHLCLFSKRSLEIICKKSGFEFVRWKWSGKLRFPIFYFKKVKDV